MQEGAESPKAKTGSDRIIKKEESGSRLNMIGVAIIHNLGYVSRKHFAIEEMYREMLKMCL